MEAYSFSSLRDMLEQPPSHNSELSESLWSQDRLSKHQVPHENSRRKTNFGKDKVTENGCVYNKKSWGRSERLFPPPISCLKAAESGDPISCFRVDENYGAFVREEIRIHRHGVLCASRDSGRLKLYFRHEEPQEEEEEQEENVDGKEASEEEWIVVDSGGFCA